MADEELESRAEPVWVQLVVRLQALGQVLRLTGQLEKNACQWDAARAGSFFETALGSRLPGKSALIIFLSRSPPSLLSAVHLQEPSSAPTSVRSP